MLFKWLKRTPPPPSELVSFREVKPSKPFIYAAYGTLYPTQRICSHYLNAERLLDRLSVASVNPIGRTITQAILTAERRDRDKALLEKFVSKPYTHTLVLGYKLRDNSRHEMLRASLNFAIPGWDTNAVARECCESLFGILKDVELSLEPSTELKRITLTSTKVKRRIWWLSMCWIHYRYLALGQ